MLRFIAAILLALLLTATTQFVVGCHDDGTSPSTDDQNPPAPKLPDLVFATVNIGNPGARKCGASFTMPGGRISVSNSGTAQATPPVKVRFGLWDGASSTSYLLWSTNDITDNTIWYPGHYFYSPQFLYTIPCNAPAGNYHFTLEMDYDDIVKESKENNNAWISSFTFYISH